MSGGGKKLNLIFTLAKIQRIGHDHQDSFFFLFLLGYQAVVQGENKLSND